MANPVHIICPYCSALNRVSADGQKEKAVCGKCKEHLYPGVPVTLTNATFDRFIQRTEVPVLVDFWAPWCGPCKMMAPVFEQAAKKLNPDIILTKVDTEANQNLAIKYGIRSIPTLQIFKNGKVFASQAGALPLEHLIQWVRANI